MYREILTKAIIAKGEKSITISKSIDVKQNVSKVLGCWIINHKKNVKHIEQKIYIEGSYDVYVWFGYDLNTNCGLHKQSFDFCYEIPFEYTLETISLDDKTQLKEYVNKYPSCIKMDYQDNIISVDIESKYSVDVIGETKLKIKVDDVIIDQTINTNYVKDK